MASSIIVKAFRPTIFGTGEKMVAKTTIETVQAPVEPGILSKAAEGVKSAASSAASAVGSAGSAVKSAATSDTAKHLGSKFADGVFMGGGMVVGQALGNYAVYKIQQGAGALRSWANGNNEAKTVIVPGTVDLSNFVTKAELAQFKDAVEDSVADILKEQEISIDKKLDGLSNQLTSLSTQLGALVKNNAGQKTTA